MAALNSHFAEVFISHIQEENVPYFVTALGAELGKQHIRYWNVDHQTSDGDLQIKQIVNAITKCTVFIPILSEGYVSGKGSGSGMKQISMATAKEKSILPIQWGNTNIPDVLEYMMQFDLVRLIYDPGSSPATHKQKLKEICDAVQKLLRK